MNQQESKKILSHYTQTSLTNKLHIYIRLRRSYFDIVEKYVPKKGKILDFGCGHGFFSLFMYDKSSKRRILGIDIDRKKIGIAIEAAKNTPVKFEYQKDTNQAFSQKYDAITILNVLYLFDNQKISKLIQDSSKSLNKNGILIITDHDATIKFMTFYTRIREFIMLYILHLTSGATLTFNPHQWWIKLLQENFSEVKFVTLDKHGFQKMYICTKR